MTQSHTPRGRAAPATSTATRGVIVVVFAFFVGFMLLWKGGGGASEGTPDNDLPGTTQVAGDSTPTTAAPPATAVPAAELKVVVANGTQTKGLAGQTADQLKAAGFSAATATDATQQVSTSQIYFVDGFEGDAQAVATAIGLPAARVVPAGANQLPIASLGDNKVVVVLGPDAPAAGGAAGAATPTTAAA